MKLRITNFLLHSELEKGVYNETPMIGTIVDDGTDSIDPSKTIFEVLKQNNCKNGRYLFGFYQDYEDDKEEMDVNLETNEIERSIDIDDVGSSYESWNGWKYANAADYAVKTEAPKASKPSVNTSNKVKANEAGLKLMDAMNAISDEKDKKGFGE